MSTPEFDRLGREEAWTARQLARRLLIACLPHRRLTTRTGPSWHAQWTFDDGPHPEHTPRVLDVLAEHHIRAAFFLIGTAAARERALVRRIHDEGHLVGSHSETHPAPGVLSTIEYLDDVRHGRETIEAIIGVAVPAFRPPHGHLSAGAWLRLLRADWQVVLWSVDPKDYSLDKPAALADRLALAKIESTDVVLLHDTMPATAVGLAQHLTTHEAGP